MIYKNQIIKIENFKIDKELEKSIENLTNILVKNMYDRQKDLTKIDNRKRKIQQGIISELIVYYYLKDNYQEYFKYFEFSGLIQNLLNNSNGINLNVDEYDFKILNYSIDIKSSIENSKNYNINDNNEYIVKNKNYEKKFDSFESFLIKNRNFMVLPDQSNKDYTLQILFDKFNIPYICGFIDNKEIKIEENFDIM